MQSAFKATTIAGSKINEPDADESPKDQKDTKKIIQRYFRFNIAR